MESKDIVVAFAHVTHGQKFLMLPKNVKHFGGERETVLSKREGTNNH